MKELITKTIAWTVMIISGITIICTDGSIPIQHYRNICLILIITACALYVGAKDIDLSETDDEFEDIES